MTYEHANILLYRMHMIVICCASISSESYYFLNAKMKIISRTYTDKYCD